MALSAVPHGTVDPWWEAIFEAAVFGLMVLWIIEGLLGGRWWQPEHRLLLPLFALVVFALVQCVPLGKYDGGTAMQGLALWHTISADPFETWRFALKFLSITLSFGLLLRFTSTPSQVRALCYVIVAIAVGSAVFGLFTSTIFSSVIGMPGSPLARASSYAQFENRNHFALLMEMAIGVLMGLVFADWSQKKRVGFYVLLILLLWASVLLTHSRGGLLTILVEIPAFFVLLALVTHRSRSPRVFTKRPLLRRTPVASVAMAGVLVVTVAAGLFFVVGEETISRFGRIPDEFLSQINESPKMLRPQIWRATANMIIDHPIAGVGFAAYSIEISRYIHSSGQLRLEQAHNDFLELVANGGLIGSGLGLWFVLALIRGTRSQLLSNSRSSFAIKSGALVGIIGVAIHSLFDFGLHITVNSLVFISLLVLLVKPFDNVPLVETPWRRIGRISCASLSIAACLMLMWNALRIGQARALLNSNSGLSTVAEANNAARLSPFDPDVYAVRASTLLRQNNPQLAIEDVRSAVQLRPRDYRLWLELGKNLEIVGETNAALSALNEARVRAPYYATAHWHLGSLLQKLARYEDAFAAYREALLIEPALLPDVMARAWESHKGNCGLVEQAVSPSSIQAKLSLAHFFIEKNRPVEATAIIKRVDNIPDFEQRLLVEELLVRKNFTEAREVWAKGSGSRTPGNTANLITDGDFDSVQLSEDFGFGWRVNEIPAVKVMLEGSQSASNRYLRIDFAGNSEPQEIVSQLVLVQPHARYQFRVAAQAQNLVSGTPLVMSITDVSRDESKVLAQTFLPLGSNVWKDFEGTFTTTDSTVAVRLAIKRVVCNENPCPIFGSLWLDEFSLRAEG